MRVFSGMYITAVAVSCVATLAFAKVAVDEKQVVVSPYSKEGQAAKEAAVEKEYFERRSIPETPEVEENDNGLKPDGLNLENVKTPDKTEVTKPADSHARAAQDALASELKLTGALDHVRREDAQGATEDAGRPDSKAELAAEMNEYAGRDIKQELSPEQKMRQQSLAAGFVPGP